jgi:shikimate dehydrogenase
MKKAAVIGFPIKHSWSPDIHNFWLKSSKIKGEYKKIKVQLEQSRNILNQLL